MKHLQKAPKKPLFTNEKEKELFISLFNEIEEENYIKIAQLVFCEGLTHEEAAEQCGYSERQARRISIQMLKTALKRAVKKIARMGVIPNDR